MRGECKKTNTEKYKEFLGLWKIYSKSQIIRKVKITEKQFQLFLSRAILENRKENDNFGFTKTKEPFSTNEDDYATIIKYPKKYNFLSISKPTPTEHQLIIRNYKKQFDGRNVENTDKT